MILIVKTSHHVSKSLFENFAIEVVFMEGLYGVHVCELKFGCMSPKMLEDSIFSCVL